MRLVRRGRARRAVAPLGLRRRALRCPHRDRRLRRLRGLLVAVPVGPRAVGRVLPRRSSDDDRARGCTTRSGSRLGVGDDAVRADRACVGHDRHRPVSLDPTLRLLVTCADRPGSLRPSRASSSSAERTSSTRSSTRPAIASSSASRPSSPRTSAPDFGELAERFGMDWRLHAPRPDEARRDPRLEGRPLPARPPLALRAG